jgi:hypothetical protein
MDLPRKLRTEVLRQLSEAGYGVQPSIADRMRKHLSTMTAVDYSYYLSEGFGFEECVYYLPNALEYMCGMRDDYGRVATAVVQFTRTWCHKLEETELLRLIVGELELAFRGWVANFRPATRVTVAGDKSVIPEFSPAEIVPIDGFLDELLSAHLAFSRSSVFEEIIVAWTHDVESVESSAMFLDFALRVRFYPGSQRLYRSPVVLRTVFDSDLIQRHLARARKLLTLTCRAEYLTAVEGLLIDGDLKIDNSHTPESP